MCHLSALRGFVWAAERATRKTSPMILALILFFDDEATQTVSCIWEALDAEGVPSLATAPNATYEPHVTLAVFETDDPARCAGLVSDICRAHLGMSLTLESLGFFPTDESVAFLGVVPTRQLLDLHRSIYERLVPEVDGFREYYLVDSLMPHCTLALGVSDLSSVARVVERFSLPVVARVESIQLVELPLGRGVATLAQR
jgi:2'-5' RNA ligase